MASVTFCLWHPNPSSGNSTSTFLWGNLPLPVSCRCQPSGEDGGLGRAWPPDPHPGAPGAWSPCPRVCCPTTESWARPHPEPPSPSLTSPPSLVLPQECCGLCLGRLFTQSLANCVALGHLPSISACPAFPRTCLEEARTLTNAGCRGCRSAAATEGPRGQSRAVCRVSRSLWGWQMQGLCRPGPRDGDGQSPLPHRGLYHQLTTDRPQGSGAEPWAQRLRKERRTAEGKIG